MSTPSPSGCIAGRWRSGEKAATILENYASAHKTWAVQDEATLLESRARDTPGQASLTPGQIALYFAPGDTNVFTGPIAVEGRRRKKRRRVETARPKIGFRPNHQQCFRETLKLGASNAFVLDEPNHESGIIPKIQRIRSNRWRASKGRGWVPATQDIMQIAQSASGAHTYCYRRSRAA
jgi:hypothetical protein